MSGGDRRIQVLRTIDKLDRVGETGVEALLGPGLKDASGAFNPGCGLHPLQIAVVMRLVRSRGATNEETLANLKTVSGIADRFALMGALEGLVVDEKSGETAWDRLLSMRPNADESWSDGGRPANIGWALDDLAAALPHPERGSR